MDMELLLRLVNLYNFDLCHGGLEEEASLIAKAWQKAERRGGGSEPGRAGAKPMSNSQSSAWPGRGPQEVTSIKIWLADSNGSVSYLRRLRQPLKTFKASNNFSLSGGERNVNFK